VEDSRSRSAVSLGGEDRAWGIRDGIHLLRLAVAQIHQGGSSGITVDLPGNPADRMPVSVRILGGAITLLFVGVAIVLCAALPLASPWIAVGTILAALGAGLLVFYGLVSREEKRAAKENR